VAGIEGNYFAPVVVTNLPRRHALIREELFAPFLTITRVATFEEAIAEANDVGYGLSAGIFSSDDEELATFIDDIEAGVIYLNRAAGATTGACPGVHLSVAGSEVGSSARAGSDSGTGRIHARAEPHHRSGG